MHIHHHHHVVPPARISLTLSRHFSLSFIASARSSGLHPVSSHSCWMYVRAGRPAFAQQYVGVHRSRSLMSSSLQCLACLVRLTWIVFVTGGRWSWHNNFVISSYIHTRITRCRNMVHHHHHVVPLARISLTLSHNFSLSFIASTRSSGLQPLTS